MQDLDWSTFEVMLADARLSGDGRRWLSQSDRRADAGIRAHVVRSGRPSPIPPPSLRGVAVLTQIRRLLGAASPTSRSSPRAPRAAWGRRGRRGGEPEPAGDAVGLPGRGCAQRRGISREPPAPCGGPLVESNDGQYVLRLAKSDNVPYLG
ncbi:hypothetical protein M446_3995 [Methylobacterium sp. 4-46]|nr:hypothetical protein M446_3995 [Methylobacterium sp. 4-46]